MNNQVLGKIIRPKRPYLQLQIDGTAIWIKSSEWSFISGFKKSI